MGEALFLAKYGELTLKGENRPQFERRVAQDIRRKLAAGADGLEIQRQWGRLYVRVAAEQADRAAQALARTFGLVAFSRALCVEKDMAAIEAAAVELAGRLVGEDGGPRFKIEARRTDKSFPLTSYQIACRLGDLLRGRFPQLQVNLTRPDWVLNVEIREAAYLYGPQTAAPGGLPLGSSGRGLLLLSGGIDSPVAGYLMGKRGLKIDALYFHTPPFTSEQAQRKVEQLSRILSGWLTGIRLLVTPFTGVQVRIRERAPEEETTLHMRACMTRVAELVARQRRCNCLVTGESLGQVASQTPESLRFTQSLVTLPVLRPLIGMDKEEIVAVARRIGTFETSILPYEDCCTLFTPAHPLIRPDFRRMQRSLQSLQAEELLEQAAQGTQVLAL
jgi:thiamine biosynthesis protein ThiI